MHSAFHAISSRANRHYEETFRNGASMRSRVFLIVLAAAALVSSGGVHPVNTYTTAAGLAADHINDVLIDSRGLCGSPRPRDFRVSTGTASSPIVCSTTRALYEWSSAGGFHRQAVPLGDGDQIGDIAADPAGRLWLALTRGLVIVENGRIRKHFTIKDGCREIGSRRCCSIRREGCGRPPAGDSPCSRNPRRAIGGSLACFRPMQVWRELM